MDNNGSRVIRNIYETEREEKTIGCNTDKKPSNEMYSKDGRKLE